MTVCERIDERHANNEIILTIYHDCEAQGYTYSLQCHLCRFVRAVFPHQLGQTYGSPQAAKRAAVELLFSWVKPSRAAKKHLRPFGITSCPCQLEFDFGS